MLMRWGVSTTVLRGLAAAAASLTAGAMLGCAARETGSAGAPTSEAPIVDLAKAEDDESWTG